jgi:hypothetical protein
MQTLMSLLSKKYKHHLMYSHAVALILRHWDSLVNELSTQMRPVNIYKNQLVVECNNPMWMSEMDYFSPVIIDKIHQLFKTKNIKIKLSSIKPVYNSDMVGDARIERPSMPDGFKDRIAWRIDLKKEDGATLCQSCQRVWDHGDICRLCELTSG